MLDDALLREDPEDEAPAPALQRQPPAAFTGGDRRPIWRADAGLAQLSELLSPRWARCSSRWMPLSHEEVMSSHFSSRPRRSTPSPRWPWRPEVVVAEPEPPGLAVAEPERALEAAPEPPSTWENLDTGNEFQALFFDVAGVTFAVPLTGAWRHPSAGEVTSLFGQPGWYKGSRPPGAEDERGGHGPVGHAGPASGDGRLQISDYAGESPWGLACHQLKGTELLHRDQVKWRHQEGKRPLAGGMVKEKMCALLHVRGALVLLGRGVNIEGR